jgi:hypothetical protein
MRRLISNFRSFYFVGGRCDSFCLIFRKFAIHSHSTCVPLFGTLPKLNQLLNMTQFQFCYLVICFKQLCRYVVGKQALDRNQNTVSLNVSCGKHELKCEEKDSYQDIDGGWREKYVHFVRNGWISSLQH